MDHITRAIEKAWAQRDAALGVGVRGPRMPSGDSHGSANFHDRVGEFRSDTRRKALNRLQALPRDIEYTNTKVVKPDLKTLDANRVIANRKKDSRVEAFRQLRSQVLRNMYANGWSTLAVTGPTENVGKTLTAVNLAISMAQEGNQSVLLVDLDLRDPSVAETLGIEAEKGIVDYLDKGEPIEEILVNPNIPRLVVLPGLPQEHHVSELLTSPAMQSLLVDVIGRYQNRIVIFDLPPLLRNDDAMVFVQVVDSCLFVAADGDTTADEIKRSMQLLDHSQLLGTVLNKER